MEETSAEKNQEPTPKRLRESREKGEIARSRELATLAGVAAGVLVIWVGGSALGQAVMTFLSDGLSISREQAVQIETGPAAMGEALIRGLGLTTPFLIAGFVAAFAAPLLFGGWNYAAKALIPDPKKLDPIAGVKRIFSMNALMELFKALAKFVMLGGLAVVVLWGWQDRVLNLGAEPINTAVIDGLMLCLGTVTALLIGLAVIAAIDVPFQYHSHRKKLKMSLQEVKDEMKETEGRPEVKANIRRVQMEMARKRMAQDIPTADVIINNPTHFAVALKYDQSAGKAPVVVAKGVDHIAEVIRELAEQNKVPQLRIPPLARSLYRHVAVGAEIPSGLYLAVAQVLSYIFNIRQNPAEAGEVPDPEIPGDFVWNPDAE